MWVRPPPSVHFSEVYMVIGMGITVDIEKAKQIILNNSQAGENSFVFDLHERPGRKTYLYIRKES